MAQSIQEIEQEMDEIKMLMKIWLDFYRILTLAFDASPDDLKRSDPEFQKIKTIVAEHHEHFMKVIKKDKHIGQSVLTTVKRTITLDGFNHLSSVERDKTLIDWHKANILLNETIGSLECEKDQILRKRSHVPDISTAARIKSYLNNPAIKNAITMVVLAIIAGVVYLNWDAISSSDYYKNYAKPVVDQVLGLMGMGGGGAPAEGGA